MTTFSPKLEEFKKIVGDFCKAAPKAVSEESLWAGFRCVALNYIGLDEEPGSAENAIGVTYFEYATNRFNENQKRFDFS